MHSDTFVFYVPCRIVQKFQSQKIFEVTKNYIHYIRLMPLFIFDYNTKKRKYRYMLYEMYKCVSFSSLPLKDKDNKKKPPSIFSVQ